MLRSIIVFNAVKVNPIRRFFFFETLYKTEVQFILIVDWQSGENILTIHVLQLLCVNVEITYR
jgi:hypothetical protein